jgi:hypothetical protein
MASGFGACGDHHLKKLRGQPYSRRLVRSLFFLFTVVFTVVFSGRFLATLPQLAPGAARAILAAGLSLQMITRQDDAHRRRDGCLPRGAAFISARLCCKLGQDRRSGANAVLTEFN